MNKKHLLTIFLSLLLFSCSEDDGPNRETPIEELPYENGYLVLNEGNFGQGNASVSFVSSDFMETENNIYRTNNGTGLGDTAQSITLYEDYAMIVLNVSNRIEIVDRYTFESIGVIQGDLLNPRYAEVVSGKIYVSNWGDGSDPNDDYIGVYNINDFSLIENISVPEGPEKLASRSGKLFVAHEGGFSFNNIISVIDTNLDEVENEIEVGDVPSSMVVQNNNLWVLSSGKPAYADEETTGGITLISIADQTVTDETTFEDMVHPDHMQVVGGSIYYTIGKDLYEIVGNLNNVPSEPIISFDDVDVIYGLSIDDAYIYIASPDASFTGNGSMHVYELLTGVEVNAAEVGINPNGVYLN